MNFLNMLPVQHFFEHMIKILKHIGIFNGYDVNEIMHILDNVYHYSCHYRRNSYIYAPGDKINYLAIIISGEVDTLFFTSDGKECLVSRSDSGQIIGLSFSFLDKDNNALYFRSASHTQILFIDIHSLISFTIQTLNNYKMLWNIINELSETNMDLYKKMQLITQSTLRDKLLIYLDDVSKNITADSFKLPMTREHLANYIGSERSSVCRELTKMQQDKLIDIDSNYITLLTDTV